MMVACIFYFCHTWHKASNYLSPDLESWTLHVFGVYCDASTPPSYKAVLHGNPPRMYNHWNITSSDWSPDILSASASLTFSWLDFLSLLPHDPLLSEWLCLITIHWKSCALCLVCQGLFGLCNSSLSSLKTLIPRLYLLYFFFIYLFFSLGHSRRESSLQVWQWIHSCRTRICTPSRYHDTFKYICSINMIACIHYTTL